MASSKERYGKKDYFVYDQYGDNPMPALGPVGIVALDGARDFADQVNRHLVSRRQGYAEGLDHLDNSAGFLRDDYIIPTQAVRFSSGEGKGVIDSTVRGHDLYILADITNYSCTYKMRGVINHMSPDDHYQDLKRMILAASGQARRINVIMPFLYESRQHRRTARESLDCAYMLEELFNLGISTLITFDAHDERVSNSVPTHSFESIPSYYQILKKLVSQVPDLIIDPAHMMVVSPDEGAIQRSMYYASMMGLPLGTFYKRRDYSRIENGRNPIIAHEFLGDSVQGMDILIVDDMISSGESMLDLARILKQKKANRIFCAATFGLFTDGTRLFDEAYEQGLIDLVISTNLIYHDPAVTAAPWYANADMTKFVALLIDAINHNASMTRLFNPTAKIEKLLNHSVGQRTAEGIVMREQEELAFE